MGQLKTSKNVSVPAVLLLQRKQNVPKLRSTVHSLVSSFGHDFQREAMCHILRGSFLQTSGVLLTISNHWTVFLS